MAVYQNAPGDPSHWAGVWGNDNAGHDRFLVSDGSNGWHGTSTGNGIADAPALVAESVPLIAVTTLFPSGGDSTAHVNGKRGVASYCGDAVIGAGEQCDNGVNNGVGCSATCTDPESLERPAATRTSCLS